MCDQIDTNIVGYVVCFWFLFQFIQTFTVDIMHLCWQVKVELPGKETQIVFDKVLTNLARTAPPVPGFRRQKGGNVYLD